MKYLLSLIVVCALMGYDVPKSWFKAGSKPADYEMGTDVRAGRNNVNVVTIKSKEAKIEGFGTLMQNFSPDKYKGKRLKLTAYMKSVDVKQSAGMWLRVDGEESKTPLAFDNMHDRAVTGTKDWTKCEIVLDVPRDASNIAYGVLLSGTGQVWFGELKFEVVGKNVPTTGMDKEESKLPADPQNTGFTE